MRSRPEEEGRFGRELELVERDAVGRLFGADDAVAVQLEVVDVVDQLVAFDLEQVEPLFGRDAQTGKVLLLRHVEAGHDLWNETGGVASEQRSQREGDGRTDQIADAEDLAGAAQAAQVGHAVDQRGDGDEFGAGVGAGVEQPPPARRDAAAAHLGQHRLPRRHLEDAPFVFLGVFFLRRPSSPISI